MISWPSAYIIPCVAINPGSDVTKDPARRENMQSGQPAQSIWRLYRGRMEVRYVMRGEPRKNMPDWMSPTRGR